MNVKTCIKCGTQKELEDFPPRKTAKDGRRGECRTCVNTFHVDWAANNKDRTADYNKKWARNNPETYRAGYQRKNKQITESPVLRAKNAERLRRYYAANPEKCRERGKLWYENNQEKVLAYREANKEKTAERVRLWVKNNPAKAIATVRRYQTKKLKAMPKWLTPEQHREIELHYENAVSLSHETGIKHNVDHIVPLQGAIVSGLHVPWNLRAIPARENQSKNNKFTETA